MAPCALVSNPRWERHRCALSWARLLLLVALCSGCASFQAVNQPLAEADAQKGYRPTDASLFHESGSVWLFVAFSGGGTRAAAFAYGVLEELRDTPIISGGKSQRLLDEMDGVSGVSGGSFPAAYYGAFGDRIFDEFEERFLRKNVQGALMWRLFAPWNLLRLPGPNVSRSQLARKYYDKHVFEHATFADLGRAKGPRVYINTTDLIQGNRFTFDQNTFDLLCSDLDPLPLSVATAASSAVPGLLSPLTLRNYAGSCGFEPPEWFEEAVENRRADPRAARIAREFNSYLDPVKKKYVHLVDGGVADNLGMTVVLERLAVVGGAQAYRKEFQLSLPDHVLVIVVNAETEPNPKLNLQSAPGLASTLNLMSGVQIHRANFATLDLTQRVVGSVGAELSTEDHPVTSHFVEVSFSLAETEEEQAYLKHLPTSFKLSDEQVDRLVAAGREILRGSPAYQALLEELR
jgi:NTE family protein